MKVAVTGVTNDPKGLGKISSVMLSTIDLACARGDRRLFTGLNLKLSPGDVLVVGGANGAGKTSLLRLLAGLATPECGDVFWCGESIATLREDYFSRLLYLGHAPAIKDELSSVENLSISAKLAGMDVSKEQIVTALSAIGLGGREHLPARSLSAGQRRRVTLARMLLPDVPPLWILDEPLTALDVNAVSLLSQLIDKHAERGGGVVLTTHQSLNLRTPLRQLIISAGKAELC